MERPATQKDVYIINDDEETDNFDLKELKNKDKQDDQHHWTDKAWEAKAWKQKDPSWKENEKVPSWDDKSWKENIPTWEVKVPAFEDKKWKKIDPTWEDKSWKEKVLRLKGKTWK